MVRLVLHGLGQPGMRLLLIGVLGLVVLLGGIGLLGLVSHALLPTRPIRATNADRSTRGGWSTPLPGLTAAAFDAEPQSTLGPRCDHR